MEIGKKQERRLDLLAPTDQRTVLAWLYKRSVDYVNGKRNESIDQPTDDESRSWCDLLPASSESDPLVQLERLDEQERSVSIAHKGFSQYSAYMILLSRCEMSLLKLADYLSISFPALRQRIERAGEHANRQLSLFEFSDLDSRFIPRTVAIRQARSTWKSKLAGPTSWIERSRQFVRTAQRTYRQLCLEAQCILFGGFH